MIAGTHKHALFCAGYGVIRRGAIARMRIMTDRSESFSLQCDDRPHLRRQIQAHMPLGPDPDPCHPRALTGGRTKRWGIFRGPSMPLQCGCRLASFAPPSLGVARAAVTGLIELARAKTHLRQRAAESLLGSGLASIQHLIDTLSDEVWLVELAITFCATMSLVKIGSSSALSSWQGGNSN